MLWELSVTGHRYRAVLEVMVGAPATEVAERFGVSRQSVHAWLRRYREEGPFGLADRSHKVHAHPWQIPAELESVICELRGAHRRWGPKRLVFEMVRRGLGAVTRSTVYRVLVRNGPIEPRSRRRRRRDYKRWERPVAMELWQVDVTASAFLADSREVKIVTGIDDHSRYCVLATAVMRATARSVCQAFLDAMATYGVPEEVLSDNGTVFTGRFIKPRPAVVLLERICLENGITQRLTRPASPTTTGKIERLHQSLQIELLDPHGPFASLEACRPRWMPGGPSTTLTGRTSRWLWPSPPPGSPRPRRAWRCGCQPGRACCRQASQAPLPRQCLGQLLPAHPVAGTICRWRWRLRGWSRRRGICGSVASRSGSARRWPDGRSRSGWMRPACTSCWMAPGPRRCRPGWVSPSLPAWPPAAPARPGHPRCHPPTARPSKPSGSSTPRA